MINWLREVDSSIWGVIMSIIMAVLRIVRDKEEDKFFRIAVEALLCGADNVTKEVCKLVYAAAEHFANQLNSRGAV